MQIELHTPMGAIMRANTGLARKSGIPEAATQLLAALDAFERNPVCMESFRVGVFRNVVRLKRSLKSERNRI